MSGSILRIKTPSNTERHDLLSRRNAAYQHILESIYRQSDNKDLATILQEIVSAEKSVLCQKINVTQDGQRTITLTDFEYNMARDILLVTLQGLEVFEGTEEDYVKTSPTEITFNYDLNQDYEVYVLIAGTLSTETFGDDIYNALSQFRQLVDVPNSYLGKGGKYVKVNNTESGLEFSSAKASTEVLKFTQEYNLDQNGTIEEWIPFAKTGMIKAIRVTPDEGYVGNFELSLKEIQNGEWIYHSGEVTNILWDIMDIPIVDVSGDEAIYLKLRNLGPQSNFIVRIFLVQ